MTAFERELRDFIPLNDQEARDREYMLDYIGKHGLSTRRDDPTAHFTASSWIVDAKREKVLMVYHNIYDSWSWTGGHAEEGEEDLFQTALREAKEETGLERIGQAPGTGLFSIEVLGVNGHVKKGQYISSHLHLNATYLLIADDTEEARVCEGENKAVRWFKKEDAVKASSEKWFREWIYEKLNAKLLRK